MKLQIAGIPDTQGETADWLAQQLVGLELAELICELRAVHGIPTIIAKSEASAQLRAMLGDYRQELLDVGLTVLPAKTVGELLAHPELLGELQELVLTEGGSYWQKLSQGNQSFDAFLSRQLPSSHDMPTVDLPSTRAPGRPSLAYTSWVVLATAASVLAAVVAFDQFEATTATPVTGWGWNRQLVDHQGLSRAEYLNQLANGAEEWFKKRPADAPALAKRIGEFRQGCSQLLLADHQPLLSRDRDWLLERCRAWARTFDDNLVAVEAGEPVERVCAAMDETVRKLVAALRACAGDRDSITPA